MAVGDQHLILRDGRRLAYTEYGNGQGTPVIYLHGTPSSRMEPLILGNEAIVNADLRLVAFDRPGIGGSEFQAGRTISAIADDVAQLADHLGCGRFAVLGMSGGGPYAAACAAKLPERLMSAVIVSGTWTWAGVDGAVLIPLKDAAISFVSSRFPYALLLPLKFMRPWNWDVRAKRLRLLRAFLPEPDRVVLSDPSRLHALLEAEKECVKPGLRGAAWDMQLIERRYDFEATDIRFPLRLFRGALDRNVSLALVRAYVRGLDAAELTVLPQDGHLSALCNHFGEIAAALRLGGGKVP